VKIGHETAESETKSIQQVIVADRDITLCDSPGFGDTAGVEIDVANAVAIYNLLHECKTVQPVLVLDSRAVPVEKGQILKRLLAHLGSFLNPLEHFISSVSFVFTHVDEDNIDSFHDQLADLVKEIMATESGKEESKREVHLGCLQYLLDYVNDTHNPSDLKQSCVANPVAEDREAMLRRILASKPLDNKDCIALPLTEETKSKLAHTCSLEQLNIFDRLREQDFIGIHEPLRRLLILNKCLRLSSIREVYDSVAERILSDLRSTRQCVEDNLNKGDYARVYTAMVLLKEAKVL